MAKEQLYMLSSVWISLWFLFLCSYFAISRVNFRAPAYSLATNFPSPTPDGKMVSASSQHDSSLPYIKSYNISNNVNQTESLHLQERRDESDLETRKYPFLRALKTEENKSDPCGGRYIYVHDLPRKFNEAILDDCENFNKWWNMCMNFKNYGFGPEMPNPQGVFSDKGWYQTDHLVLEVIFNQRMKHYDCLTNDSSLAAAIYVPFYAGYDIFTHLYSNNTKLRDALSYELVDWLTDTPEWKIMGGKDHFLVAGRVTWAFRRYTEDSSGWGNKLLLLPEIRNMSTLLIESSPYHSNDFAIPYPSHFHPRTDGQVLSWQDRIRKQNREWLFCFAGAPRQWDAIRNILIDQCNNSKVCKLVDCASKDGNCFSAKAVSRLFQSSHFCLQPPGDSPTRRSIFDAILAGCVPVFFHPASAYVQYTWHLPKNYSKYSVFISEVEIREKNVSIEERLRQISPERIREMRNEVIDLIPKIVYADPLSKSRTFKDAFDIALDAVISRVTKLRKDIIHGRKHENFHEQFSWKYSLLEDDDDDDPSPEKLPPTEWDSFF